MFPGSSVKSAICATCIEGFLVTKESRSDLTGGVRDKP